MEECIFGKFSPSRLKRKKEEKKEDEDVRVAPHLSNQPDLNLVFITVQAAETGRLEQKKKNVRTTWQRSRLRNRTSREVTRVLILGDFLSGKSCYRSGIQNQTERRGGEEEAAASSLGGFFRRGCAHRSER